MTAGAVVVSLAIVGMSRAGATTAPQQPAGCPGSASTVAIPGGGSLTIKCKWVTFLNGHVEQSSPVIADLGGSGPSVVVGTRDTGLVYALALGNGQADHGWPVEAGAAVDSSPTALPTTGGEDDVVVDAGDVVSVPPMSLDVDHGSVLEISPGGREIWKRDLPDQFDPAFGENPAVYASPAVADTTGSGSPSIVTAGVSLSQYELQASTGATEVGWPQKTADSTFSTAAISDLYGGDDPVIIAASDSTAGSGALYDWNGGVVRAETGTGQVLWSYRNNEVVTSSPAVGNLDGSGDKVVFGHGRYWSGLESEQDSNDATAVTALNSDGTLDWQDQLGGYTPASPALADLTGNGQLDVVEPTWTAYGSRQGGDVYAIAPDGQRLWGPSPLWLDEPQADNQEVIYGGVATADFSEGYQDVVAAAGTGWNILDGKTGVPILPYGPLSGVDVDWDGTEGYLAMQNTPLVTPDPSGQGLDVVLAGSYVTGSGSRGFVAVYQVTSAPNDVGSGPWPMFHHDPQHTGSASEPALSCRGCVPHTPSRGYWLAAKDGGVFAYGGAPFEGSMGGRHLNAPIVGMASTPNGDGYWLVASDGGIFSFGDALFYGSMGGRHLNAPVVGMARSTDGLGYWLVASDGGIFSFGDAFFHGSMGGVRLVKPVVGIQTIPGAGGYWEMAADGGVFSFDAPFYGSMGGRYLAAPVVGAGVPSASVGGGYWEVGSDGGIFAFGQAPFQGSAGRLRLVAPVVAMSPAA